MSYTDPNTNDSLNDLICSTVDFNNISNNLLECRDFNSFIIWFEKLKKINKRALFFFLRKNKEKLNSDYIDFAQKYFKREI